MGLITTEVTLKPKGKAAAYYRELGYNWKKGESITVPISDLQKHSSMMVKCICDYCGQEFETTYNAYNRAKDCAVSKLSCSNCASIKQSDVLRKIYGVSNISQIPEVKQKKIETNYARYGTLYTRTEECKQKVIQTNIHKYGIPHHTLDEDVKQKAKATNLARYGSENPFGSLEIQEKIKSTMFEKGSVCTSCQQQYISNLYNMIINYPIKKWNVDMVDLKDKLITEYDGGGHWLQVEFGAITMDEFRQKERMREIMIKRAGYKMMRIISRKDYLPIDSILLQMLCEARQYFSEYPKHSWITFDIDEGTVKNAECERSYFYGELRKISKKDLEAA